MKLLEASGLYNGRLMRIAEPHLVARYNEALTGFGLPETRLGTFQIDMTGFSPEVAEELEDIDYLDPGRINRRYIILSPQQRDLPVIHTAFSNTGQLMHEFFDANARAINALTIKDVIYGEIDDPVLEAKTIEDLLSIEQVTFRVFTGNDLSDQAVKLRQLVDRLEQEDDAWRDDAMIEDMIELAKVCGDIRSNALVPKLVVFRHEAFWTSHFGGVYVFIDDKETTVIGDPSAPGFRRSRPWTVSYIDRRDEDLIYRFLMETGRIELPRAMWIERSDWITMRRNAMIARLALHADPGDKPQPENKRWVSNWLKRNAKLVEEQGTIPFLNWAERTLDEWSSIDVNRLDTRGRYILSRAKPNHPDAWLVNRLISDYVPFDWLSRYAFNKPSFFEDYRSWGENQRSFVVDRLRSAYLPDKAGWRERHYGLKTH